MKNSTAVFNTIQMLEMYILDNYSKEDKKAIDLLSDINIQAFIERLEEYCSKKEIYQIMVDILVENFVCENLIKRNLIDVFHNATELTIFNYRNYLMFKGYAKYDEEKNKNGSTNVNLSVKLFDEILSLGATDAIYKYKDILSDIARVNLIDESRLFTKITEYYYAHVTNDIPLKSKRSAEIKDYIKKYNSKIKEQYAHDYIEQMIKDIEIYFQRKASSMTSDKDKDIMIAEYININGTSLSNTLQEIFGKYIEGELLQEFVSNFFKDDSINFDFLGLIEPSVLNDYRSLKSYKRLKNYYLDRINECFDSCQLNLINQFLNGDKSVTNKLTKVQQGLLNEIRPLLLESQSKLIVDISKGILDVATIIQPLSDIEKDNIEHYRSMVKEYYELKKNFFKYIKLNQQFQNNNIQRNSLFRDDYYELNGDYGYLCNLTFVANVIDHISCVEPTKFWLTDEIKEFLYRIIPCFLVSGDNIDVDFLSNFFGIINRLPKTEKFSICELSNVYKLVSLYKYIDETSLNILGEEVCKKLVFNNQFIEKKNDESLIKQRLEKAVYALNKAYDINKSSIPYFDDIKYNNITLQRYNNVDPSIFTSGIDTNTCFKLDGNDNDYLLYSMLSANGLVIRILEDGVMCGRITAHLYYNLLIINGIRNIKNEYRSSSSDDYKRNQDIIKAVELLADRLIDETKDAECPIDFVCTNMAGILESHMFWEENEIVCVNIKNPIDTYNDDFIQFKKLFENRPEYLSQVSVTSTESYWDKSPFTTDFGSYPLVLIKAREGKSLRRRSDIAYSPQPAVYERPAFVNIVGSGYLTDAEMKQCDRIRSLCVYNLNGDDVKLYIDISRNFKQYVITDSSACFETKSGKVLSLKIRDIDSV